MFSRYKVQLDYFINFSRTSYTINSLLIYFLILRFFVLKRSFGDDFFALVRSKVVRVNPFFAFDKCPWAMSACSISSSKVRWTLVGYLASLKP